METVRGNRAAAEGAKRRRVEEEAQGYIPIWGLQALLSVLAYLYLAEPLDPYPYTEMDNAHCFEHPTHPWPRTRYLRAFLECLRRDTIRPNGT